MTRKKVYRLYREERLTVHKRGGRKRALGMRAPMAIPQVIDRPGHRPGSFLLSGVFVAASSAIAALQASYRVTLSEA